MRQTMLEKKCHETQLASYEQKRQEKEVRGNIAIQNGGKKKNRKERKKAKKTKYNACIIQTLH
jgi:hypothetical protein